jgi:hypothetical protein
MKSKRGPGHSALLVVQKYFPEVKSVQDATANVSVEVTREDDMIATKKSHKSCAMAVACKRKLKLNGVIVSVKTAYMIKGERALRFHLPEHTSIEVVSFSQVE